MPAHFVGGIVFCAPMRFLPFRGPLDEPYLFFYRGVGIGIDGSVLADGDLVYILANSRMNHTDPPVQHFDYWHGLFDYDQGCVPVGQMMETENDFSAFELVGPRGYIVQRLVNVQRRWRKIEYVVLLAHSKYTHVSVATH